MCTSNSFSKVNELSEFDSDSELSSNELIKEAIEYNEESYEKICKSCYEKRKEDNNEITETEERLRKIKGLIKYFEIEVTEGELLMLI
ncbi:hypothetical protein C1646_757753 [Rhizophagus diaphanus]|nr:hypothetical protein C1646_757753 [Rhizophagus diaphanus] [Rhizophagus sp. MUCL 43196]